MKVPNDKIRYGIISEEFPNVQSYFDSYETALYWAKIGQQNDKPFCVVKCTEKYEAICENEEKTFYSINELYKQLIYSLHVSVNCEDGNNEIVQLVGKALEICREKRNLLQS